MTPGPVSLLFHHWGGGGTFGGGRRRDVLPTAGAVSPPLSRDLIKRNERWNTSSDMVGDAEAGGRGFGLVTFADPVTTRVALMRLLDSGRFD